MCASALPSEALVWITLYVGSDSVHNRTRNREERSGLLITFFLQLGSDASIFASHCLILPVSLPRVRIRVIRRSRLACRIAAPMSPWHATPFTAMT